ncbi:MAG TPA: hypothetical protein VJY65_02930 [Chloroflexota bacterium]|nr:hypothetical protein [Chloroflexota bacterium]
MIRALWQHLIGRPALWLAERLSRDPGVRNAIDYTDLLDKDDQWT